MKKIVQIALLLSAYIGFSQKSEVVSEKYTSYYKGKFYFYWGGNRDGYTKSDIRFTGSNYDFTVQDVVADDKPKGWHIDYINPGRMTIPQTNFRLGYFVNDHYGVSIGVDHMKYVLRQFQTANITGNINLPVGDSGNIYNGNYNNTPTVIGDDLLTFEHTDGLNYINIEVARIDDLSRFIGLPNTDKFQISLTEGIGAGVLFPKTNTMLLSKQRHDEFHVSGYGVSAKAGLNFTFFKHYFIQTEIKTGYINMSDIRTSYDTADKASQHFLFLETVIAFGGIFRI
jgi:hypothetical protein